MCENCSEFQQLLLNVHPNVEDNGNTAVEDVVLTKEDISVSLNFINVWHQKQCMCIFRESKNVERFSVLVQAITRLALAKLKQLPQLITPEEGASEPKPPDPGNWTLEDTETLVTYMSRMFMLQFPLYLAAKQAGSRLEDLNNAEATSLAVFLDVSGDVAEIPLVLLQNVAKFCRNGGLLAMTNILKLEPTVLPHSLAHGLVSILCNLKLWLNPRALSQLFSPVRAAALQYLCKLSDQELRQQHTRAMADFLWSCNKDSVDSTPGLDREGLELAFKYFSSTTLTMRLGGINQVNAHISLYNQLCTTESGPDIEALGCQLADWILESRLVDHILGPNLHVELIKQSHVILNFLAMEGRLTNHHIEAVWQAAQLKHCTKQVHDLLSPLIKNLEAGPVLHLLHLLKNLPIREHSEQTIYLAQVVQRFIWSKGGAGGGSDLYTAADTPDPAQRLRHGSLSSDHRFPDLAKAGKKCSSSESSDDMDIQELAELDDEQDDLEDGDDFSEDEDDDLPSSSDGEEERILRQGAIKGQEQLDTSVDLDDPPRPRTPLLLPQNTSMDESSDPENFSPKASPARTEDGDDSPTPAAVVAAANSPPPAPPKVCVAAKRTPERISRPWGKERSGGKRVRDSSDGGAGELELSTEGGGECCSKKARRSDLSSPLRRNEGPSSPLRGREAAWTSNWDDGGQGAVMTELANLVGAAEDDESRPRLPQIRDLYNSSQYIRNYSRQYNRFRGVHILDTEVSDEGSTAAGPTFQDPETASSHNSDRNLADFVDEEETCEEELARLAQVEQLGSILQQQQLAHMAQLYQSRLNNQRLQQQRGDWDQLPDYRMDRVTEPGSTLLWDLVQEGSVEQLGEGLALEAEKALTNLLCYNMERVIRMRFIEGCLKNLETNRSVVISLKLLPKLLQSFHNFPGSDTHDMTMYIEKCHKMTQHFFDNLQTYTSEYNESRREGFYSHSTEVQVRLHFLAVIFSYCLSPDNFRLSQSQVSVLWECLSSDPSTSEDLFQWLLAQSHSKEQHALTLTSIRFIYREKLPELKPETLTMTGLNLLSQFGSLVRSAEGSAQHKMDQVWRIALQASNTDVSLKAIHLLNSAYLGRGEEFITTGMFHLQEATSNLSNLSGQGAEQLLRIQRALLLLKSHLETFRRKYAYHFRRLAIEGKAVSSHAELVDVRHSSPLRIVVQPGGAISEKITLDMKSSDLVADLRAEIAAWWEEKVGSVGTGGECSSMLGSLLGGAVVGSKLHLRLISQGQELSKEMDERSLADLGFKDMQLVFANINSSGRGSIMNGPDRGSLMNGSDGKVDLPPFPGRNKIPMLLLLASKHFDQLFSLMSKLSSLTSRNEESGLEVLDTKAQILSRRVWEIILLLPTNPDIKRGLQNIDPGSDFESLLDPSSPQKLLYSFYIVDWLGRPARLRRYSGIVDSSSRPGSSEGWSNNRPASANTRLSSAASVNNRPSSAAGDAPAGWVNQFIEAGGLSHLFRVFLSGILGRQGELHWSEWKLDCLGFLLRLLVQFGVHQVDVDTLADQLADSATASTKKRNKWIFSRKAASSDRMLVPTLSPVMIDLMKHEGVPVKLGQIFSDASSHAKESTQYKTGLYGRSQVIHFAMSLLVSWVYSSSEVNESTFAGCDMLGWLRHLLLLDPDPSVRREICTGVYRLCLGSAPSNGATGLRCIGPVLAILLEYLDEAQAMKPHRRESFNQGGGGGGVGMMEEPGKEPFGSACRDYFWVMAKLVEGLQADGGGGAVDIEALAGKLVEGISSRPFYERRHGGHSASTDDALIGMLNLMSAVLKQRPNLKQAAPYQEFVKKLFHYLYALPSPSEKLVPKCKSPQSRSACYDLLVDLVKGCLGNYEALHGLLLTQHVPAAHKPYPWEYWPSEQGRSECGYVGLVNLGATCYMATCVQQLFMIPAIRECVLQTDTLSSASNPLFGKHQSTLQELRRMFAYLLESERKAYNPLSFCKTYTMDQQPLNTGEQKDMAEFFIDLLSKMEEMSGPLKANVKTTFCGTLSNNVVSLDCGHVSTTSEEFYTVRCQVAEMRSLYQSLEEVCVKDMLEGDNMYTCSQCGKKVRAEKRACFKSLPDILAFNTMRYSFNMVTMLKEKVNTHFSFPMLLDMTPYMEHTLIPNKNDKEAPEESMVLEYELIGVTVHTGNADGGHYYAFCKDRTTGGGGKDKWFSFNDAEVKSFEAAQLAAECFGGEMSSRTYDQVTDKFLDLSIEKTNSAYMLFYQRVHNTNIPGPSSELSVFPERLESHHVSLAPELEDWIWQDNRNFIQDNNVFDHTYFNFMWQMVGYIPTTLNQSPGSDITLLSSQLATSFFLETFIHAKEKLNIVQWVELITKQLDSSASACRWFLTHMAVEPHWPVAIFLRCSIPTIRQMFHRLLLQVIPKLRSPQYLQPTPAAPEAEATSSSPVSSFVQTLLKLLESGTAKPHLKHLTELFSFILDFGKLGDAEAEFLLSIEAVTTCVEFYLKTIGGLEPEIDVSDEEDEDDDIIALPLGGGDLSAARTASLDKMVTLIAMLVEKSRGPDNHIHLSQTDLNSLTSGKSLIFLYNITKDNINIRQTCNLIFSLTRHNPGLAESVAEMVFLGVKSLDHSLHFFRLLTLLTELSGGPAGLPCYTSLVMCRVWDLAKACPQAALDWLSIQVTRNKAASSWLLNSLEEWVQPYLINHTNGKVRNSAAFLLVSLVPSLHLRQTFRTPRGTPLQIRDTLVANDGIQVVTRILEFLLSQLEVCRNYIEITLHGTNKLVSYFQVMTHLLLGRPEKLLLAKYFQDLWNLFHPKLSEPSIPVHPNKQALLQFWYTALLDCKENVQLVLSSPQVVRNLAFNYILADHEDSEVVAFNRSMLPIYYGLLRLCCAESRTFCRSLAQHQNIQWAFKNISPYSTQYTAAVDELMKLIEQFVAVYPDSSAQELQDIKAFKTQTLQLYLSILDGRSSSVTLISVLRILLESPEDKIFTVCHSGLSLLFDAFNILHLMYHEATACHVTQEIRELVNIFLDLLRTVRTSTKSTQLNAVLSRWKEMGEMTSRLVTLCNSFTPTELKESSLSCLKEMLLLWPNEMLGIMVPMFHRSHISSSENDGSLVGPYFPRRDRRSLSGGGKSARPPRPMLQLSVSAAQLEASHGQDPEYDKALHRYFWGLHNLVDLMVRVAVNEEAVSKTLVDLSAMVGVDGVPLHFQLFPKLWLDIYNSKNMEETSLQGSIRMLTESSAFLEYVDAVLLDERSSLNNQYVYQFLQVFFPKVSEQVINHQVASHIQNFVIVLESALPRLDLTTTNTLKNTVGDLRALLLVLAAPSDIQIGGLGLSLALLRERIAVALQEHKDDKDQVKDEDKAKDVAGPSKEEPKESKKDDQKPGSSSKKSRSVDKLPDLLGTLSTTVNALIALLVKRKKAAERDGSTAGSEREAADGDGATAGRKNEAADGDGATAGRGNKAADGSGDTADAMEPDSTVSVETEKAADVESAAAANLETKMDLDTTAAAAAVDKTGKDGDADATSDMEEEEEGAEKMADSSPSVESKSADSTDKPTSSDHAASKNERADESP